MPIPGSTNSLVVIVTTLATVGFGAGAVKIIGAIAAWWKAAREEKRLDQSGQTERRRADRREAIDHYENLIRRISAEHDESRALWTQERTQLIQERDRLSASYHYLVVQATMMQDRLAVYQGVGTGGAERMDPVLVMQGDGTIRWANDPAGTFLGYSTLSLFGQPMSRVIPRERHNFFRSELQRLNVDLDALPDNMPLRHAIAGKVRRRDGTTVRVCVLINGFRVKHACSKCGQADKLPVYRVHLRQRWEDSDLSLNPPNVPANSSDGIPITTTAASPGADDPDVPARPADDDGAGVPRPEKLHE
jgi:PAS domain-containing protein